ncbi:MAG: glutathione S-transferase N-terminal domain-containing protein, partial [Kofleriaceae bacterium]|nr:glutathione S-transferase N-terminal domain-containing protein [Kofleriaceae bacterium]
GKKNSFPHLVDPNTDTALYESEDIIDYLYNSYGTGRNGVGKLLSPLNTFGAFVASAVRLRGSTVSGNARTTQPAELLELYNFEASPYCRKVREALCELDLDCRIRNVAKNSERRDQLKEAGGKVMVPYLIDPNTETQMYESDEIVEYLHRTYG